MNIQEMKERKKELGYSYAMVARLAGVSIATVKKIFGGEVESPRHETLRRLEEALSAPPDTAHVREVAFKYDAEDTGYTYEDYKTFPEYAAVEMLNGRIYPRWPGENPKEGDLWTKTFDELVRDPRNGSYTYEDYLNFPDEIRVEVVRGRIYAMAAPDFSHQIIVGQVFLQISNQIKEKKGDCVPVASPIDVRLFKDSLTTVQPDVLIVCDRNRITGRFIDGAPDFVVEVLSPSTAAYDKTVKLDDYRDAGVRELWIVDYRKRKVHVHLFDSQEDGFITYIHDITEKIPLRIYEGEISVDFGEIDEYIRSIG